MSRQTIQAGATLTNGSSTIRLTQRGTGGWHGVTVSLSQHRSRYTGSPDFLPDYQASLWSHVPFEWTELPDSGLEHRYAWEKGCRWLRHETRKAGQ